MVRPGPQHRIGQLASKLVQQSRDLMLNFVRDDFVLGILACLGDLKCLGVYLRADLSEDSVQGPRFGRITVVGPDLGYYVPRASLGVIG